MMSSAPTIVLRVYFILWKSEQRNDKFAGKFMARPFKRKLDIGICKQNPLLQQKKSENDTSLLCDYASELTP